MAVPKRKTSKERKHTRSANRKISAPALVECSHCHELKKNHEVCPYCGYYDGKEVVAQKTKKAND